MAESGETFGGRLLVADPDLEDPNFFRAVVLLLQHTAEGAFGLVVNRPTDHVLRDVLDEVEGSVAGELPLRVGGPVERNYLFVLHSGVPDAYRTEHAVEVVGGVTFEPGFNAVREFCDSLDYLALSADQRPTIRVLAGYAGWGPGQLEAEVEEGAWVTVPVQPEFVFAQDAEAAWRRAFSEKGTWFRIIAETGYKPSLN